MKTKECLFCGEILTNYSSLYFCAKCEVFYTLVSGKLIKMKMKSDIGNNKYWKKETDDSVRILSGG